MQVNLDTDDKPHVVVLGAGLAGLSVALAALRARPCHVTILEKEAKPGGMAISLKIGNQSADLGPHRIYSTIPEMREWFRENLGDSLISVRRISRMYMGGQFLHYPPHPLELIRVLGPVTLAKFAGGYLAAHARAMAGRLKEDSFASVMEKSFGRAVCDEMIFPYIEKVWKLPPTQISPDVARARVTTGGIGKMARRMIFPKEKSGQESTLKHFHYLKGGIETLVRRLAKQVRDRGGEIYCGTSVEGLSVEGGRIRNVRFKDFLGIDQVLPADFVFSTIPVPELVESLGFLDREPFGEALRAACDLRFLNIILVYVVVRRPSLSADHWLYFPQARPRINRAYEPRNFDRSMAEGNQTLLCIEGTALPGSDEWKRSDDDLAQEYVNEILSTGLFRRDEIAHVVVHRLENAYPLYRIGYEQNLAILWKHLRRVKNLMTLGRQGVFLHNNMDHSIFMGLRAAECWAQGWRSEGAQGGGCVEDWYDRIEGFRKLRIVD